MNFPTAICPICGYDGFDHTPEKYEICPSCLFEFGMSDADWTHEELRQDWIAQGAKWAWGSQEIPSPAHWSAIRQLCNVGYHVTNSDLSAINKDEKMTAELTR